MGGKRSHRDCRRCHGAIVLVVGRGRVRNFGAAGGSVAALGVVVFVSSDDIDSEDILRCPAQRIQALSLGGWMAVVIFEGLQDNAFHHAIPIRAFCSALQAWSSNPYSQGSMYPVLSHLIEM